MGGAVSAPLLYSIFNPDTPGHDGAVLVEDERVSRFAAHLPLAEELPDVSRYGGTRHAAALGLSQQCDAMVIVISEERGTLSIAHDGRLTTDISAVSLRQHLRRFLHQRDDRGTVAARAWWSSARLRTVLVSIALAVALWMAFVYSPDTVMRTFTVPIALRNLPEGWMIEGDLPMNAEVEVSGSRRRLDEVDPAGLSLTIDVSEPTSGVRDVVLSDAGLALPSGITFLRARPAALSITFRPTQTVSVPVAVQTTGVLPEGLELVSVRPEPDVVSLVIPKGAVGPDHVPTEAVDLRQIDDDAAKETPLVLPPDAQLRPDAPSKVVVRVDVRPRQ
jgi:hypothetical protein